MNFVNRHVTDRGDTARVAAQSLLPRRYKWPVRYDSIEHMVLGIDIATIFVAGALSTWLYQVQDNGGNSGNAFGLTLVSSACFVSLLKSRGLYRPTELLVVRNQIRAICMAWTLLLLLIWAASGFKLHIEYSPVLVFAVCGLALLIAQRGAVKVLLAKGLSGRKFANTNIVLISDQPLSKNAGLSETLATQGFCVKGRFSLPPIGSGPALRRRISAHVIDYIRSIELNAVVLEAAPERWSELRAFVADLRVVPFPIMFVPVGTASEWARHPLRSLGSAVCAELQPGPLTAVERAGKRIIDLVGAGLALMILAPGLAAAAVAIKLDSAGPVFFRQKRCGFNGQIFSIRKFRTMHVLEDGPVIIQATPIDPRVTRVGKWLRRTSFDELPQLLNVLDGSMSLVGPRPHALPHDGQFDKLVRNYAFRRRVKPGLSGWAQIHGCRGPTPTADMIERRVQYDLWYIDNWSLRLDLAILIRTPIEILRGRNAC
jgi:Undecaprenyl-phosphate glucose phosphotransferase